MAKRNATAEELEAQAKSNGYKRGANREKDSARDDRTYNDKTKRNQNVVLDRYVMEDSRPVRTSILTLSISDGLSYRCEKTRFSEISSFPTRPAPGITVFNTGGLMVNTKKLKCNFTVM
jgi:hypothetical protein